MEILDTPRISYLRAPKRQFGPLAPARGLCMTADIRYASQFGRHALLAAPSGAVTIGQRVSMQTILNSFPDQRGTERPVFTCRLGTWTRPEFVPRRCLENPAEFTELVLGEEYFEWMDILEAALDAPQIFTFLELGAGYGRWSSRAAAAARMLGKKPRLGLAEAEPQHIEWLRLHMSDNGISQSEYRLYDAAVAGAPGQAMFMVEMPPGELSDINNNRDWYGQALSWHSIPGEVIGEYYGRPLVGLLGGWRGIEVPQITLSSILADYDRVDLIDFDTQGSEGDCIEEAVDVLTEKVRRLHIGTHSADVENRIVTTLTSAGWECLRRFDCLQENDTPLGRFAFTDGVQSWRNPWFQGGGS